jgi:cyclopropane fatty-acyl-phospholipid synthase-like methyltransferase
MFEELERIASKPKPFEFYTTPQFWNDPHISKSMLDCHLNPNHNAASYRMETIDKAVDWMASHFNISGKRICDFGCGPGLYTVRFAEKGAIVTGVDVSERSIQYAKDIAAEKNLTIEYVLKNYLQFSTDNTYDLITMISCDFPVLSPKQRKSLLGTFHKILNDNGAVILDVDSLKRFAESTEKTTYEFSSEGGFWSSGPHHIFENNFKYEQEKVLLEKYALIEKNRRREVFNWHQCYSLQSLKDLFQENGFQIAEYYSNITGDPFEEDSAYFTVVARKTTLLSDEPDR